MKRSPVWHEVHMVPMRLTMQTEDDQVVVQMPGYRLDTHTFIADSKEAGIEGVRAHLDKIMWGGDDGT